MLYCSLCLCCLKALNHSCRACGSWAQTYVQYLCLVVLELEASCPL